MHLCGKAKENCGCKMYLLSPTTNNVDTLQGNTVWSFSGVSIDGLLSAQDGASIEISDSIFLDNTIESKVCVYNLKKRSCIHTNPYANALRIDTDVLGVSGGRGRRSSHYAK